MPRGARVISLVGMPCREYWPMLRNGHLGAMVIVRRDGFSNDQWLLEGVNLLDLKYRAAGYFAADPSQLVRPNRCLDPLHRTIDKSLAALAAQRFRLCLADRRRRLTTRQSVAGHEAGLARTRADPLSDASMTALSIVVPCFNEEACLAELHQRLGAAARKAVGDDYELVLVNDGSRDGSWPIMQRMAAERRARGRGQPVAQSRPPAGADRRARPVPRRRRS